MGSQRLQRLSSRSHVGKKTSAIHRLHSKVYHKTRNACVADGLDDQAAKDKARAAAKAAVDEFKRQG